jgi:cell division protease FtsH
MSMLQPAHAIDFPSPPPFVQEQKQPAAQFPAGEAPPVKSNSGLPEGNVWRYSEFLNAVQNGKVERVRFSKDGAQLQLTAVDGRRASVTLPNDSELVDFLARNGVDISVSEGEQQGNLVALLGNLLFPLLAFAGLFLLFRRSNSSSGRGGMGGGPMGGAACQYGYCLHLLVHSR